MRWLILIPCNLILHFKVSCLQHLFSRLVDLLVGRLFELLFGGLVDWWISWLVGGLVDVLDGELFA